MRTWGRSLLWALVLLLVLLADGHGQAVTTGPKACSNSPNTALLSQISALKMENRRLLGLYKRCRDNMVHPCPCLKQKAVAHGSFLFNNEGQVDLKEGPGVNASAQVIGARAGTAPHKKVVQEGRDDSALLRLREACLRAMSSEKGRATLARRFDTNKTPCQWRGVLCRRRRVFSLTLKKVMLTQEVLDAIGWLPQVAAVIFLNVTASPQLDFQPLRARSLFRVSLSLAQGGHSCHIRGFSRGELQLFVDVKTPNVTIDWASSHMKSFALFSGGSEMRLPLMGIQAAMVETLKLALDTPGSGDSSNVVQRISLPRLPPTLKTLRVVSHRSAAVLDRGRMRWEDMKELKMIDIDNAILPNEFWNDFGRAPNVTALFVTVKEASLTNGTFPGEVAARSGLKTLKWRMPAQSGWSLPEIPSVDTIRRLSVYGFNLTSFPPNLGSATHLEKLWLEHCGLTAMPEGVEDLKNLHVVDVSNNNITSLSPKVRSLARSHKLLIRIAGNPYVNEDEVNAQRLADVLGDFVPDYSLFSGSRTVKEICMAVPKYFGCDSGGNIVSVLLPSVSMKRIPIEFLPYASTIEIFDVRGNGIREFPGTIARALVNIKHLDVRDNALTEAPDISKMGKLEKLYMGDNHVRDIAGLRMPGTGLVIDISGNDLMELPSSVFLDATGMSRIIASRNSLARIATNMGMLQKLELLDVSRNNLTSEAMSGLHAATRFSGDRILDASYNPGITQFPDLADPSEWSLIRFAHCSMDRAEGTWNFTATFQWDGVIDLQGNKFTSFPKALVSHKSYKELNMHENQIRTFDMDAWASSQILLVNMSRNAIADATPLTLADHLVGKDMKKPRKDVDISFNQLMSVPKGFSTIFSTFTGKVFLDLMGNDLRDFTHFSFPETTITSISDYSLRYVNPFVTKDESKELLKFLRSGKEADSALETFSSFASKIRSLNGDTIGKSVTYDYYTDVFIGDPLQSCDVWGLLNNGKTIEVVTCYCESSFYRDPVDLNRCRICPSAAVCEMDELLCNPGTHGRLVGHDVGDDEPNVKCDTCPEGGVCNGITIVPEPGYWKSSVDSSEVHSCSNPNACAGGVESECNPGYRGIVCGECDTGYFSDAAHSCAKCPEQYVSIILFTLAVLGILASALAFFVIAASVLQQRHSKETKRDNRMNNLKMMLGDIRGSMAFSFKVGIGFLQVITSLDVTFDLEWPHSINIVDSIFGWVNLDVMRATSLECVWELVSFNADANVADTVEGSGFGYGYKLALTSLIPLGVTTCLFVVYWVMRGAMTASFIRRNMGINMTAFKDTCTQCNLLAWQLCYLPLSYHAIQFFHCVSFDDGASYYNHYDLSTRCYDDSYWRFASAAFITIVVCTIGMPAFIVLYGLAHKNDVHNKSKMGPMIIVFRSYKKEYFYWEALELIRKVVVGGAVVVLSGSSTFQMTVAMGVMFAFTVAHFYCLPNSNHVSNIIQGTMLCLTYFTMSLGILRTLQVPAYHRDLFSGVVIGLDILAIVLILGMLAYDGGHIMYEELQVLIKRFRFFFKKLGVAGK